VLECEHEHRGSEGQDVVLNADSGVVAIIDKAPDGVADVGGELGGRGVIREEDGENGFLEMGHVQGEANLVEKIFLGFEDAVLQVLEELGILTALGSGFLEAFARFDDSVAGEDDVIERFLVLLNFASEVECGGGDVLEVGV
jgi:hypothetical protein